ncbi:patatin-like phospholipase family protein [Streptomyces sp. NPDC005148]
MAAVVGAGGVLGAAHVGVGYALEKRGFVPDLIIGTSVGALNGAIAAAHPDRAAPWLDHVWTQLRRREVYPLGSLSSRAVDREGRTLVDGGVIAYVPVLAALQAGAASVVVLSTGPESSPLSSTLPRRHASAIAARARLLLMHHQIERDLHEVSKHIPTVVLPTGVEAWPAPWDFGHSQRLISTASLTAGRFLDGLRISGPGLYRADDPPAPLASPGEASISSVQGVAL